MKCIGCNSSNLEIVKSGPHNKLVCKDCLKFQMFLSKGDADIFNKLKEETTKPKMIKGNEELFNTFTDLSYLLKNAAGIVQNDMEITEDDKRNFKQVMYNIRLGIDELEEKVLNHLNTIITKPTDTDIDKYDRFIEDALKNTKALNEDVPWN